MTTPHPTIPYQPAIAPSPLLLCDKLITLAQQADRAGFSMTAHHLALLAETMFEEQPRRTPHRAGHSARHCLPA